jgi:glycerol-3-phosphate acyltransferase PlsY
VAVPACIITALGAYLLGSLPTGYLVARARGVDIRTVGSRNMGATNVFRVLGRGPGVLVLLVDGLKGLLACAWLAGALPEMLRVDNSDPQSNQLVAGLFSILGHNYTCWLRFKGGKGIATTAGVFLALSPLAVGFAIAAWMLAFALTRYVSIASIAAAVVLPAAVWSTRDNLPLRVTALALGALAIYKHKANIQRLMNGTESRFDFKKKGTPT